MFEDLPDSDSSFLRALNVHYEEESERLHASSLNVDVLFACYLREMSRFGYFQFGPISIDVNLIDEIVERTTPRRPEGSTAPIAIGDDVVGFSQLVMEEVRRSGRRRIDEMHYLLAFMKLQQGLPARVFGELGITAAQVEEFISSGPRQSGSMERLYSPEEVGQYLNVHVQTVRTWIRSGRLRARRLAGQRSLRITESDLQTVLEPLSAADLEAPESRGV
jgi:excisionase family DNA binding protein